MIRIQRLVLPQKLQCKICLVFHLLHHRLHVLPDDFLMSPFTYPLNLIFTLLPLLFFLLIPHTSLFIIRTLPKYFACWRPKPMPFVLVGIRLLGQVLIHGLNSGELEKLDPHLTFSTLKLVLFLHKPRLWVYIYNSSCTMVCPNIY